MHNELIYQIYIIKDMYCKKERKEEENTNRK